ncbi:MAG: leucyl aminopeptidase [Bacteroidales bacterium]|nr:leucyl aminopeptidase [Bacteroidales bacterium]
MNIRPVTKITSNQHLILIGKDDTSFGDYITSSHEIKFLANSLKQKKKQVAINQYNRWVFIQLIDNPDKTDDIVIEDLRKAGDKLQVTLNQNKIKEVTVIDLTGNSSYPFALVEGLALGNYQFLKYLTKTEETENSLKSIRVPGNSIKANLLAQLDHNIQAVYNTRNLVNEPLSFLTAVQLSKEIERMGKEAGFTTEVFQKKKIESLRMGGLLAVNKGSIDPPTFTIMTWKPEKHINKKPYVLVGKGIVFDTGGISLKSTHDSMDYMKCDMAGAATVAGAMYAVAKAKLPLHVIGLAPATDNRPDGNSYVPGDVIKMYDGTTVEVLNTDAEGRMILADALSWAKKYDPELVINLATLTGSAHAAIGKYGIVGMGNASRVVMDQLKESGDQVCERIAEFPFWDDYAEMLKSDIADLKNIGGKYAGAITAGKFLEHFTGYPFIHLDIAGPSFNKTKDKYWGKGGSGMGVRLLFDFLKRRSSKR